MTRRALLIKKRTVLVDLSNPPLSRSSFPEEISAIRDASSPQEALRLYKRTLLRAGGQRRWSYSMHTHAAVFTVKSVSRLSDSVVNRNLHAHLLKTCLWTNGFVAAALLHCYVVSSSGLDDARRLYDEMPIKDIVAANTLLKGYFSNCGLVHKAPAVFDELREKDTAVSSAKFCSYMNTGKFSMGLKLFRELMEDASFRPDEVTFLSLLSGFTALGSMGTILGKSVHGYCVRKGLDFTVSLTTALIDLYAKSGCLISASRIFKSIPLKDVRPWTAMICGLALHGYGKEAILSFEEMKNASIVPNGITFTGVLNACCHSGLVDEAKKVFHSMTAELGLQPTIHHYGCMVELLGKAGRLEEAYDVIAGMSMEPNLVVLTSFLASCKRHKNCNVASRVLDRILEMPIPDGNGGIYPLVADVYAMGGQWDNVERVKRLMEGENTKKTLGRSAI